MTFTLLNLTNYSKRARLTMTNWIYLGNFSSIDTDETDIDTERPNLLLGTYDQNDLRVTDINFIDGDGNGNVNDDETGAGDRVQYLTESGASRNSAVDSTVQYRATITKGDGSSFTENIYAMQLVNGDVFVVDANVALDNKDIQSIQLTKVRNDDITGLTDNLSVENSQIVCFTSGTMIATIDGEVPVENLSQGDQVLTLDNGYQPIRWIGYRTLSGDELERYPNLRPIRIRAGALGSNRPIRDLLVSPQHRVLVRSKIARRMFNSNEVLVAAKHFLGVEGIDIVVDVQPTTYFHFLFDRHEIVLSNGAPTESFFCGPQAMNSISESSRSEILALFPELLDIDFRPSPSRNIINGTQGRRLARRHEKNEKSLIGRAIF